MNAVFAGGGTAGHLFPGIVMAERILRELPFARVLFITGRDGGYSPDPARFRTEAIDAGRIAGRGTAQIVSSAVLNARGVMSSIKILKNFGPDVIIGTGGYVSAPPVLAGLLLGFRVMLLEQNCVPGLTTRLFGRFVREVELSFPEARSRLGKAVECRVTGNPVRRRIFESDKRRGLEFFGLSPERKTLVVMGGSSGALSINEAMLGLAEKALRQPSVSGMFRGWQVVHLTGRPGLAGTGQAYARAGIPARVYPFLEEIQHAYAAADLAVSRSGGNAVSEITVLGIPAVYIPYPFSAGNHQEHNAAHVCQKGGGVMLDDAELSAGGLEKNLFPIMADDRARKRMGRAAASAGRPEAEDEIFKRILAVAGCRG